MNSGQFTPFCSAQTSQHALCHAQIKCASEPTIQEWDGSQKVQKEDRAQLNHWAVKTADSVSS